MKKILAVTLFCAGCLLGQTQAQTAAEARDLFRTRVEDQRQGTPGAKITLELLRNGTPHFVPLDTLFYAGDKVKLHFELNFPAYVQIFNRGTSGKLVQLFPYPGATPQMRPGARRTVPESASEWFEFDRTPGAEELLFAFSATPIVQSAVAAHPTPKAKRPGPIKPDTRVQPTRPATAGDQQDAMATLNARALDEAGAPLSRDLKRVRVSMEEYFFCQVERLTVTQVVGLTLQHR